MILFLVLAGAAAVYLLQNKLYEKNWSRGLLVSVDFERKQAVKGDTVNLVEVITNQKILPLLMVHLKFIVDRSLHFKDMEDNVSVSDQCYKNDVFSLLFYQKITRTLPFVCERRGFFTITEADLVSSNLFLNIQYVKHLPLYTELTVFPGLADGERLSIPFKKIMGELLTRRYLYEDPFEFRGIREYSSTDTMSSINWKATARTGEFKVNVHDYTASQEICILLNLESETNWESDQLMEECISIAAGLCEKLISHNVQIRLVSNGCDLYSKEKVVLDGGMSAMHMDAILTSLARIDLKLPMESFVEMLNHFAEKEADNTLYVMVSVASSMNLQKAYENLAQKTSGAMWILPYRYQPQFEIKCCPSVEVFPWEVTANEK